jgi:tetratricopeptide (TPR) repeat protein
MRFLLFVLLLASAGSAAPRDQDLVEARRHYKRGMGHYNLYEYDAAIREFQEAYRLHPEPAILFNLGQAYRGAGDVAQALRSYRTYLREDPENRVEVERRIADLERLVALERRPPSPAPMVAPAPIVIAPPPPAIEKRPREKRASHNRWWLWTTVGVIVVGAGVGVGLGLGLPHTRSYPQVSF